MEDATQENWLHHLAYALGNLCHQTKHILKQLVNRKFVGYIKLDQDIVQGKEPNACQVIVWAYQRRALMEDVNL